VERQACQQQVVSAGEDNGLVEDSDFTAINQFGTLLPHTSAMAGWRQADSRRGES